MPTPGRKERLESLLHQEIATCVQREIDDTRCGLVTITRVEMTGDLHHVKAYYSVIGDGSAQARAARALERMVPTVQSYYAKAIRTRLLPLLTFVADNQGARRFDIDALISQARQTDSDGGTRPEGPAPEPKPAP
jgi:ribosome-binding factor A